MIFIVLDRKKTLLAQVGREEREERERTRFWGEKSEINFIWYKA